MLLIGRSQSGRVGVAPRGEAPVGKIILVLLPLALLPAACGILAARTRAADLVRQARAELQAGQLDPAIALVHEARDLDPSNPLPYLLAADALRRAERDDEAAAELELALRAVRIDPALDQAALLLADTRLRQGQPGQAVSILRTRIRQRGPLPELVVSLAELLLRTGRSDEARQLLVQTRRRASLGPAGEILEAIALASSGRLSEAVALLAPRLDAQPDVAAATLEAFASLRGTEALLERLHAARPADRVVTLSLARNKLLARQPEQSLSLAREAVAEDRSDPEAQYVEARALLELGRTRESLEAMRRSLETAPPDLRPRLYGELASLHAALAEPGEAAGCLREALNLEQTNLLALDNLALLARQHPEVVPAEELRARLETARRAAPPGLAREIEARLAWGRASGD